jgi:hypothetical protein
MSNLNELLGLPETYISTAQPGDVVLVHVDPDNTEEQMFAHGKKVKEALPDCTIVVLPKTVRVSAFPMKYTEYKESVIVGQVTQ